MKGLNILKGLGYLALFLLSVALVLIGQTNRGILWIGVMLLGLAGLLALLFLYNRKYTRADRLNAKKLKESGKPHRS